MLTQYFDSIVDVEFTAGMESRLDEIADGLASSQSVLGQFYDPFALQLSHADEAIGHVELPVEVSDIPCDLCGRYMVVKQGRFGNFLACPGFPECRNTKAIVKDTVSLVRSAAAKFWSGAPDGVRFFMAARNILTANLPPGIRR